MINQLLTGLRVAAESFKLGLPTTIKLIANIVTVHFDDKNEAAAYMRESTWKSCVKNS